MGAGRATVVCVSMVWLGACGGAATEAPAATESASVADEAAGGEAAASVPWAEMTSEQKGHYMDEVVMPAMEQLFKAHNPSKFAEFDCATCHGDNAREVGFRMPNTLDPLDPAQIPAFFQSQDRMAVFMAQEVWPKMTELLGKSPYNPETGEGFGCLGCHATAEGGQGHGQSHL